MTDLMIYDIPTDRKRPATQNDIDQMQAIIFKMALRSRPLPTDTEANFTFKLAVYPNPMRSDGVFVAEDKEIEPYEGISGWNGESLYPATPSTPYGIGSQLPKDFACELVRRWNKGP